MKLRQTIKQKLIQYLKINHFLSHFKTTEPTKIINQSVPNLELGCEIPYKILVGTHHKTGTAWLSSIFKSICNYHSLIYYEGKQDNLPEQFDLFFQDHSKFDFSSWKTPFRGVHMIRDPRDVIVSGCFYHKKSREEWLHKPRKEFNGLTYQQKINSYSDINDQILFEMENVGKGNIDDMLNWNYIHPSFYEIKYEDLIEDTNLMLFHEIFNFLEFPGKVIPSLLAISYNNSLFSGKLQQSVHIRSGKKSQWKQYFKQIHKERFWDLFNNALIKLGYEQDHNWMQTE